MVQDKLNEVQIAVRSRWVLERCKKDQSRPAEQYRSVLELERTHNRQLVERIAEQQTELTRLKELLQLVAATHNALIEPECGQARRPLLLVRPAPRQFVPR